MFLLKVFSKVTANKMKHKKQLQSPCNLILIKHITFTQKKNSCENRGLVCTNRFIKSIEAPSPRRSIDTEGWLLSRWATVEVANTTTAMAT